MRLISYKMTQSDIDYIWQPSTLCAPYLARRWQSWQENDKFGAHNATPSTVAAKDTGAQKWDATKRMETEERVSVVDTRGVNVLVLLSCFLYFFFSPTNVHVQRENTRNWPKTFLHFTCYNSGRGGESIRDPHRALDSNRPSHRRGQPYFIFRFHEDAGGECLNTIVCVSIALLSYVLFCGYKRCFIDWCLYFAVGFNLSVSLLRGTLRARYSLQRERDGATGGCFFDRAPSLLRGVVTRSGGHGGCLGGPGQQICGPDREKIKSRHRRVVIFLAAYKKSRESLATSWCLARMSVAERLMTDSEYSFDAWPSMAGRL